jgi:hypothetical protein
MSFRLRSPAQRRLKYHLRRLHEKSKNEEEKPGCVGIWGVSAREDSLAWAPTSDWLHGITRVQGMRPRLPSYQISKGSEVHLHPRVSHPVVQSQASTEAPAPYANQTRLTPQITPSLPVTLHVHLIRSLLRILQRRE